MTNVRKDFDFNGMDHSTLLARYNLLREEALAKGEDASIDTLREMVAICAVLRRGRTGGPPKVARSKAVFTVDDL